MLIELIKKLLWIIPLTVLSSCDDTTKEIPNNKQQYAGTQEYLFQLLDDYKTEYFASTLADEKENIQAKYQDKMKQFLVDSLDRWIDSMTVFVDTVIKDNWLVTTQFHTGDIEFKYGLYFKENMVPKVDSLYKFMINLSPGKEVTVNFVHLGAGELNFPDDTTKKIMRIFAYPSPLNY